MFVDFNEKLRGLNLNSINSKEEFLDIFYSFQCFKSNVSNFNEDSSLKVAHYFALLYACGDFKDKDYEDAILHFVKNTKSLSSLEVLYYTSYTQRIDSTIVNRIISLDKNKEVCLRIFEYEGTEYCPKDIMICIVNGAEINSTSASHIYNILWHFEKNLGLSLFPQGATTYQRWIDIFNYCINNNCVDDNMIKYLKDCSSDEDNNLDYCMLKRLSNALELYL